MRTSIAATGSALFFAIAPGTVAGLILLLYAAIVSVAFVAFGVGYEQPTLRRQFGARYDAYQRAVPAWWPRLRPWRPEEDRPP